MDHSNDSVKLNISEFISKKINFSKNNYVIDENSIIKTDIDHGFFYTFCCFNNSFFLSISYNDPDFTKQKDETKHIIEIEAKINKHHTKKDISIDKSWNSIIGLLKKWYNSNNTNFHSSLYSSASKSKLIIKYPDAEYFSEINFLGEFLDKLIPLSFKKKEFKKTGHFYKSNIHNICGKQII